MRKKIGGEEEVYLVLVGEVDLGGVVGAEELESLVVLFLSMLSK